MEYDVSSTDNDILFYSSNDNCDTLYNICNVDDNIDNNNVDDRGLYHRHQQYLYEEQILGKVLATIPYAGYLTILLNDYPYLKMAVLGGMLLSVLLSRDPN